jgi:hypothetical protein
MDSVRMCGGVGQVLLKTISKYGDIAKESDPSLTFCGGGAKVT